MHHFTVEGLVSHPASTVWALIDDFADTAAYHPFVERSFAVNGRTTGLGATRQCDMYSGQSVQETITVYAPAARRYALELTQGDMPLNHLGVEVEVCDEGDGHTTLKYHFALAPKFGPLGWVMAKTMMIPQFKKMIGQLIEGVDRHLETGQTVGRDGVLEAVVPAAA